ncbi:Transcription and mRNA export factor ENY2 [Elsinoe australis]|uniref:Transcription and mRNA export factor ENY2 n=1 Tax=Elsinoe australis TaxID=40998 RepID=A0A2P7YFX4_9PEZI|nr:Transcription and mRNA export factor ENY2 [Elsinoe australis]
MILELMSSDNYQAATVETVKISSITTTRPCTLLSLPREIQDKIYRALLELDFERGYPRRIFNYDAFARRWMELDDTDPPFYTLSLYYTCTTTRRELKDMLFEADTIDISLSVPWRTGIIMPTLPDVDWMRVKSIKLSLTVNRPVFGLLQLLMEKTAWGKNLTHLEIYTHIKCKFFEQDMGLLESVWSNIEIQMPIIVGICEPRYIRERGLRKWRIVARRRDRARQMEKARWEVMLEKMSKRQTEMADDRLLEYNDLDL